MGRKECERDGIEIYTKERKKERLPLQSAYRLNRCDDLPFLGRRTSMAYRIVRLLNYEIKDNYEDLFIAIGHQGSFLG